VLALPAEGCAATGRACARGNLVDLRAVKAVVATCRAHARGGGGKRGLRVVGEKTKLLSGDLPASGGSSQVRTDQI
jgi:hypothetical protein